MRPENGDSEPTLPRAALTPRVGSEFTFALAEDASTLALVYDEDAYQRSDVEAMRDQLRYLLEAALADASVPLARLPLLGDDDRWGAFSKAARRRAVERFTTSEIVPKYEALYRDVLKSEETSETSVA